MQVLPDVVAVKRGSEVTAELTLTTGSGEQVWQSRIVYLVMHRHRKAAKETPAGIGEKLESTAETVAWSLPENLGRVYGAGVRYILHSLRRSFLPMAAVGPTNALFRHETTRFFAYTQ